MRVLALVLATALLSVGLSVATPEASAYPCRTAGECIDLVLRTLGCHATGGDPLDPLNYNFGDVLDCVLDNMT